MSLCMFCFLGFFSPRVCARVRCRYVHVMGGGEIEPRWRQWNIDARAARMGEIMKHRARKCILIAV